VATVRPEDRDPFERVMAGHPCACVGQVREDARLCLALRYGPAVEWDIATLKQTWKDTLDRI